MSKTDRTPAAQRTALLFGIALGFAVVLPLGLVVREYGPGNMGNGLLAGGFVTLAGICVMAWRVTRRPQSATTFERGFTQAGDERDDEILTRTFAVMGACSVPAISAAAIAIALGADAAMILAFLLYGQLAIGAASFVVVNRRR